MKYPRASPRFPAFLLDTDKQGEEGAHAEGLSFGVDLHVSCSHSGRLGRAKSPI